MPLNGLNESTSLVSPIVKVPSSAEVSAPACALPVLPSRAAPTSAVAAIDAAAAFMKRCRAPVIDVSLCGPPARSAR